MNYELIARMLEMEPGTYTSAAIAEQARLLREADNASQARTVNRSEQQPAGDGWEVRAVPVAVWDSPNAHRVTMKRGVQTFHVGPEYWDTRGEADGFARMLLFALTAAGRGGEAVAWQIRRTDGSLLAVWENCTREAYEDTKRTGRYAGFANGPFCETRALYAAAPQQPPPVGVTELLAKYTTRRDNWAKQAETSEWHNGHFMQARDIVADLTALSHQQAAPSECCHTFPCKASTADNGACPVAAPSVSEESP